MVIENAMPTGLSDDWGCHHDACCHTQEEGADTQEEGANPLTQGALLPARTRGWVLSCCARLMHVALPCLYHCTAVAGVRTHHYRCLLPCWRGLSPTAVARKKKCDATCYYNMRLYFAAYNSQMTRYNGKPYEPFNYAGQKWSAASAIGCAAAARS
jgi:hypothetical protein